MRKEIAVNLPIEPNEVPALRELVGWEGRHSDYPILFERCNFWAGLRDDQEGFGEKNEVAERWKHILINVGNMLICIK